MAGWPEPKSASGIFVGKVAIKDVIANIASNRDLPNLLSRIDYDFESQSQTTRHKNFKAVA
jgi:hypothetical protein